MLAFIPRPVIAVVLLFPITQKYEAFRRSEESQIRSTGQTVSPDLYFVRQTIGNACGTIGLLHALANNLDTLRPGPGPLKSILDQTMSSSPDDRAKVLETSEDLARVHEASSREGQTSAPSSEDDVDTHFIAFVKKDGCLYEMDGRKPFPINHGSSTDVLVDSVKVIKQFMERDPDNLNFTVIALAPAQQD
ncbi:Ubiquitin carboxyl-terminal hydrolase isozyme L3 [Thoreauomyces humboldtii]|nr:Ubiquitin carboxyl-terminal hydrolase isozyme L3 [Thoreauomyces humboldtii]